MWMYHFRTALVLSLITLSFPSWAELSFEGIYAIEKDGVRTGYMIQRAEVDRATKKWTITTYQRSKVNKEGAEDFEVTRAFSRDDSDKLKDSPHLRAWYTPLEFSHRSVSADVDETIKASFKGKKIVNVDATFGKSTKIERTDSIEQPQHSFLWEFLYYMINFAKVPAGEDQSYVAFSTSSGRYSDGTFRVEGSKKPQGLTIYHLQDFFEGEDIETFVFDNGDAAGARNVHNKTLVYLVNSRDEAVQGFEFPQKEMTEIFGDLPDGQKNPNAAAGKKLNLKSVISSFPAAKPTRKPNSEKTLPDIRSPVPN